MAARKIYIRKGTDLITAIVESEYIISVGDDPIPSRRYYRRLSKDETFFEKMYTTYLLGAIAEKCDPTRLQYTKTKDHPLHPDHVAKVRLALDINEMWPDEFLRWRLTQTNIPRLTETIEHVQSHKAKTGRNI